MSRVMGPLGTAVARKWWTGLAGAGLVGASGLLVGELPLLAAGIFLLGLGVEGSRIYGLRLQTTEFKAVLDASLQPLARGLHLLASKTTKKEQSPQLASVLSAVIHGALQLAGAGPGVRASLFHRVREGPDDLLVPHPSFTTGRGDDPVSRFVRGAGEGKAVWDAAERDEVTFFPDIKKDPPEGMDKERVRSYRTFITAPIRTNGNLVGLLTINAPNPGDLRDEDALMMRILATHAGAALQMCGGVWPASGTT